MFDYIDIHAHVNFAAFDADRDEVIRRALDAKTWVVNVGTQSDTAKKAIEIAHAYEKGVYAIVGLHPVHTSQSFHDEKELGAEGKGFTSRGEIFDPALYRMMAEDPKVVAIGECGLDYYRLDAESIQKQKTVFLKHIELVEEVHKPLMLHLRSGEGGNAYKDAYEILKNYPDVVGNVHFFAGSLEEAKLFVDLGYTLSFTGVITFAREYAKVIKELPLEVLMTETDCPYVTPLPYRGKRNEPIFVKEVVRKIAEIKGIEEEEVRRAVAATARRFFRL